MSVLDLKKRTGSQCVAVSLPELLQLSTHAKQVKLSALRVKSSQAGQHLSRLLGKGMEFAESRRYQAGDDIRCIDWRITARTGKAHTKLFTEEKERQILLWIDMRSSMFFATQGVFKSVQAALMASYIGWNAALTGNRLGGFIFDEVHQHEFRPLLGKKSVLPLLQKLTEYGAHSAHKLDVQSATKIMDEAVLSIQRVASPGSLIFLLSDFRYLSQYAQEILMQVARHSDICLFFIYDSFEVSLPKKEGYFVTDGQNELKLNMNQSASKKYSELFTKRKNQLLSLSNHQHIHLIELSTQNDCFEILKKNFR